MKLAQLRPTKWYHYTWIMFVCVFIIRFCLTFFPNVVEHCYSRFAYFYIASMFSLLSKILPFSVSEMTIICALIFSFGSLVWIIHQNRKQKKQLIQKVVIYLTTLFCIVYSYFMMVWGFNYLRAPLADSLAIDTSQITAEQYQSFAQNLLQQLPRNPSRYDIVSLNQKMNSELQKTLAMVYNFEVSPPITKNLFSNAAFDAGGVSGIFLPFFMEPHTNTRLLAWEYPCVALHEKGHFYGFASERDANLIAYITGLRSDNDAIRYSVTLSILTSLRYYLSEEVWKTTVWQQLPEIAQKDIEERNQRILEIYNKYPWFYKMGKTMNDSYLKLNSQELGIASYQTATPYIVLWWQQNRKKM